MRVFVYSHTAGDYREAFGPAELSRYAAEHRIELHGEPTPEDHGRWAGPLGMAALRGATIQKGQTA